MSSQYGREGGGSGASACTRPQGHPQARPGRGTPLSGSGFIRCVQPRCRPPAFGGAGIGLCLVRRELDGRGLLPEVPAPLEGRDVRDRLVVVVKMDGLHDTKPPRVRDGDRDAANRLSAEQLDELRGVRELGLALERLELVLREGDLRLVADQARLTLEVVPERGRTLVRGEGRGVSELVRGVERGVSTSYEGGGGREAVERGREKEEAHVRGHQPQHNTAHGAAGTRRIRLVRGEGRGVST